jgi:MurNAc alpha-1-phosphate uridylyltransferase
MTVCAVVLAAGEGRRLRPITANLPKALCPVGNVPLLDRVLARLAHHGLSGPTRVAVNACYLAGQVVEHVGNRAYLSEEETALGTSGAIGQLREWIAGRGVLVANADAYLAPADATRRTDLAVLFEGWTGTTVRVLAVPADRRHPAEFREPELRDQQFGGLRFAGCTLLPADVAAGLPATHSDLVRTAWRPAEREGRLELIRYDGLYLDTGTVEDFLEANLHAAGPASRIAPDAVVDGKVDRSVVGSGAEVHGTLTRSVVFPGGYVGADEHLVDAIRVGADLTVPALPDR